MDKAYKASDEEKDVEKALTEYIKKQELAHSPMMDRDNNSSKSTKY